MLKDDRTYTSGGGVSFNTSDSTEKTIDTSSSNVVIHPCQLNFLNSEGFPNGLAKVIAQGGMNFSHRFWIIDNSESMKMPDGNVINEAAEIVISTRWEEIKDCVTYHVNLAAQLFVPSTFRVSLVSFE